MAVRQAEFFMSAFPTISWIQKLGIRPQQTAIPTSQTFRDVLDQRQMIYQDVRRNALQAYIKHKTNYDKKANTSMLKETVYLYVLQAKADHQASKIPLKEFRWFGPYIIEKCVT